MTGQELFNNLSKRDYSGSDEDNYAQLLNTLYRASIVHDEEKEFFLLLEKADQEGKQIAVKSDFEEIFVSDLTLV